jgi:hypothetical protein
VADPELVTFSCVAKRKVTKEKATLVRSASRSLCYSTRQAAAEFALQFEKTL